MTEKLFSPGTAVITTRKFMGGATHETGTFVRVHDTLKGPFFEVKGSDGALRKFRPVNVSAAT